MSENLTPNEFVADQIISAFRKKGLLPEETIKDLKRKLVAGAISANDWKIMFEEEVRKSNANQQTP